MPFDGLTATYLIKELQGLRGAKVERVHQPHRDMIILNLRAEGRNQKLLLSANAVHARVHTTSTQYTNPLQPPLFCMVLRKHLEGTKIQAIEQQPMERSFRFIFTGLDELGRPTEKHLIIEIMGKHSNIILTTSEGTILDGIRRYTHEVSRHREILPGEIYIAPPSQDKIELTSLTQEQFSSSLFEALTSKKLVNIIQNVFLGLSTQASKEIVARADLSLDIRGDELGEYELIRLWDAWKAICPENEATASVLTLENTEVDFYPYRPTYIEGSITSFATLSDALNAYYSAKETRERFQSIKAALLKIIQTNIEKLQRKLALQETDLLKAEDASIFRIYGELLTANLWQLPERAAEVTLDNFYDNTKLTIPLEKELTIPANAQKYFKKYNKAKQTLSYLTLQKEETKKEISYLSEVESATELAEDLLDIQEIRKELEHEGYVKAKQEPGKKKKEQIKTEPHMFVSPEGYTINVGKNNLQNDRLTMRSAQPTDIWLHTKDIPGSHVIIRAEDKEVPYETIVFAAELAAKYSKARLGNQVPVDYTEVKNVKKPNGAKPGYVIYDKQKTVFVTPTSE